VPTYATYGDVRGVIAKSARSVTAVDKVLTNKTLFLSHSSRDEELLPGVLSILEGHGASVYVDILDHELPRDPCPATAERLKTAITACPRFVLFLTPNTANSVWIPWELGLADSARGHRGVALLPVCAAVSDTAWTRREYLDLYQRVVWGRLQGETGDLWFVWDHHENTGTALSKWCRP